MDVIDVLGSLLGRKASQPGRGTDILKDIFNRHAGGEPPRSASRSRSRSTIDIDREAARLEELLNVANARERQPAPPRRGPQPPARQPPTETADARPGTTSPGTDPAIALIRAMVNAAKSDGRIDAEEQRRILDRLQDRSPQSVDFLRGEFRRPLDIDQFAKSVPIGMEQQVYMLSLIAIDLDTRQEAGYLMQLADALRIPVDIRQQIHRRWGAPDIYQT